MRLISTLVLLLGWASISAQTSPPVMNEVKCDVDPLLKLKFDEVKAYTINFDSKTKQRKHFQMERKVENYSLQPEISGYGSCFQTTVPREKHKGIVKLFSDKATYGDGYADCFEPRFVLQFNHKQKEVFRLVICEGCGFLESTVPIPAAYAEWDDHEYDDDDGKPVIYRRYKKGFSEKGALAINKLCKELGMAYCKSFPD